jgi:hypothetical protein
MGERRPEMGTRRRGFVRFSDGLGADGKHAAAGLLFCGPRVFFLGMLCFALGSG